MKERERHTASGFAYLVVMILIVPLSIWGIVYFGQSDRPFAMAALIIVLILDLMSFKGLFGVSPNQGAVLQLFGRYVGTERSPGSRWANPPYAKRFVSLRTRNFETGQLKVNDLDGNPIELAAVVVWNVVDTYEAIFQVDSYENYVKVQSEAALRNLAAAYPYDGHDGEKTLRGSMAEIAAHMREEIQERLQVAGVEVKE